MRITFEIAVLLLMILANGLFSMAEMAVVSSRAVRLRKRSDEGSRGAQAALQLAANPSHFLSTVQVGITLIGTLTGAVGGATLARELSADLARIPMLAPHSESIAITLVVLAITYFSLIFGELVPKSLALGWPEGIASALAKPMSVLARLGSPVVRFLSFSTSTVMRLIPVQPGTEAPVTEEEIKLLMRQGAAHGTFDEAEQEMVEGVFRLGDRRVAELMKPQNKVLWLDIRKDWSTLEQAVLNSVYSRFLVGDGDLDHLIGLVHVKDLFAASRTGSAVDLRQIVRKPMVVPESMRALSLLESFQKSGDEFAVVTNEHGAVEGIITLTDVIGAVVGDLSIPGEEPVPQAILREDGSWLMDGAMGVSDAAETLGLQKLPGHREDFTTLGGMLLHHLGRIPQPGDHIHLGEWRFEVADMDRHRVDKLIVSKVAEVPPSPG